MKNSLKSIAALTKCRDDLQRMLRQMAAVRDRHASEVATIRADTTRKPEYIRQKVNEVIDRSLAEIGKPINEIRALVEQVHVDLPYWRQTQFLLAQQHFHRDDPALENATRARHLAELNAMPNQLLEMTFDLAKREGNLPLIYQCYLAGQGRDKTLGWRGMDLQGIEIPEQTAALDLIAECATAKGEADFVLAEMSERRTGDPLAIARSRVKQTISPLVTFEMASGAETPEPAVNPVDSIDAPDASPEARMNALRTAQQAHSAA